MDENKITPQQSMAIITAMIENSKHRMAVSDLRISLMWASVSIATAIAVYIAQFVSANPWCHVLWAAIPVVGIPLRVILSKKNDCRKAAAKTFVDTVSDGVWKTVGYLGLAGSVVCFVFNICGYPQAWIAMLLYAFVVVGLGAVVRGILLRESSYVVGGLFSVVSGGLVTIVAICGIPLLSVWVIPLYVVCFSMMFIVPAFVIYKKLKKENERA